MIFLTFIIFSLLLYYYIIIKWLLIIYMNYFNLFLVVDMMKLRSRKY
jgi:hypothetical protein